MNINIIYLHGQWLIQRMDVCIISLLSFILMWFRIEWNRGRIEKHNISFYFNNSMFCTIFFFIVQHANPFKTPKKNMLKYNFFSRAARYVDEIWNYRITWIESWSGKKHTIKIYSTSFAILWKHSFIQYSLCYVFYINVLDIW